VLERLDSNNLGRQQKFHEKISFKTLKEVKQACTMYNSMWRVDYEKPMRTGHKQVELELSCFS
jgi:hypothetical protein